MSSGATSAQTTSPSPWFGRWLLFSVIFFGLPLLLAWLGAREIWQQRDLDRRQELQKRLEDLLSSFEERVDPAMHIGRLLRQAERTIFPPSASATSLLSRSVLSPQALAALRLRQRRVIQAFKRRYPGIMEFTVLDGEGQAVPELCDFPGPRALLKKLYLACRESRTGDARAFSREAALIKSFLGPMIPAEVFLPRQIQFANNQAKRRMVYLSEVYSEGMIIIHLTPSRDWRTLTLNEHLERQRRTPGVKLALVDLGRPASEAFKTWNIGKADINRFFSRFLRHPFDALWKGDACWMRRTLGTDLVLVGRAPLGRDREIVRQKFLVGGGLLGVWGIFALISGLVASGRIAWEWSVRTSLVLAFIYTAGLPILVMGLTARSYLQERRSLLERQLQNDVERSLVTFDAGFPAFLETFGQRMSAMVRDLRMGNDSTPASFSPILESLKAKLGEYDYCEVITASGTRLMTEMSRQAIGNAADLVAAVSRIGGRILRVLDPEAREVGKDLLQDKGDTDWLFTRLVGNIGNVAPVDIGNSPCLLGQFAVYDQQDHPCFLVILFWSKVQLEREFLRLGILDFTRRLEDTTLYAFNRDRPDWSIPARCPYPQLFRNFLPQVLSADRGTRNRLSTSNGIQLMTGIRGTMLAAYSLAGVSSDRTMRHELSQLSWRLFMAGWIVLAISVTIGMMVARAFLAPIKTLGEGVVALQERRFQTRLTVGTSDEFGHLTESFNEMMEGLADLELAKVIQESLFPSDQLSCTGTTVFGTSRAASEVGGDYFEYAQIDETSLAIVIGDVSGHGVSAALVMAMARAVFAHPGSGKDPARGLAAMNTVLLTTLKRKKMMTCLFGIVEVQARRFRFCNAGQCYPVLVRGQEARLLELPGKPLGTGQKRSFETTSVDLQVGDWLMFSTDGLFEALTPDGQQLGYEGVLEALPAIIASDAREHEQKIRTWHDGRVAAGPLADDITVIVCHCGENSAG